MIRHALIAALLACSPVWAAHTQIVLIDLMSVDAASMAAMFAGEDQRDPYQTLDQAATGFALDAMQQIAQIPSPGRETILPVRGASAGRSLNTHSQNLSYLLPEGLVAPPTAAPNRNALIVRGTFEAIDEFREVLALLDVPAPMVNIALRLDEVGASVTRSLTPEMHTWGLRADVDLGGPAIEGNRLSYGLPNVALLGGLGYDASNSRRMTEAQVTGMSGQPSLIGVGEVRPWFSAHVYYDAFGGRHIDYIPHAAFVGVTFWVLPQVIGDNMVRMHIAADFSRVSGPAPDVRAGDITVHQMIATTVTVADGQPLVIGGLRRQLDEANTRWPRASSGRLGDSDSIITVTPRIIHPMDQ